MEGLIFGLIDNGILIISGFYSAFSIEKYLSKKLKNHKHNGLFAGLIGAGIGNAISDFVAGLPISLSFAIWVFIGCLIPLLIIPILIKFKR